MECPHTYFSTSRAGPDGKAVAHKLYWCGADAQPFWEFRMFYQAMGLKTELYRFLLQGLPKVQRLRDLLSQDAPTIIPSHKASTTGTWQSGFFPDVAPPSLPEFAMRTDMLLILLLEWAAHGRLRDHQQTASELILDILAKTSDTVWSELLPTIQHHAFPEEAPHCSKRRDHGYLNRVFINGVISLQWVLANPAAFVFSC